MLAYGSCCEAQLIAKYLLITHVYPLRNRLKPRGFSPQSLASVSDNVTFCCCQFMSNRFY